jgi:Domain of unknown function (DUF4350)
VSAAVDTEMVATPTVRRVLRRWLLWIGIATIILLMAVITVVARGSGVSGQALGSDDPSPGGAKALIEVLRSQGVTVTATSNLSDTESAAIDSSSTTLVLYDYNDILSDSQLDRVSTLADRLILLDPSFLELNEVTPSVGLAGAVDGELVADCDLGSVSKAGTVTGTGNGYRLIKADDSAISCLGSGDKVFSLIQVDGFTGPVTVLGTTAALSNGFISEKGNAALALNLLGENQNLIWYIPDSEDLLSENIPTIPELTPGWLIQVTLLLAITAVFAAFWRGRRMGPLIVENLPVVVRASETMQGRARLYARSSARLHALDSLRIGTVDRLGKACGLPSLATVKEVSDAVAALTGRDPAHVHRLLFDARPSGDRELVQLSDALIALEKSVTRATRPE